MTEDYHPHQVTVLTRRQAPKGKSRGCPGGCCVPGPRGSPVHRRAVDLGTGGRKIKDVIQQVAGEGGSPEPLGHNAGLKVGEDLFRLLGG